MGSRLQGQGETGGREGGLGQAGGRAKQELEPRVKTNQTLGTYEKIKHLH